MRPVTPLLSVLAVGLLLSGCDHSLNQMRENRFTPFNQAQAVSVKPQALVASLYVSQGGSLTPESLANLNTLLRNQGRLKNQTLTLRPFTPAGETISQRLAAILREQGAQPQQVIVAPTQLRGKTESGDEDLQVISEALVVTVPDCAIADPKAWTVKPYEATGPLGCANRANIARMVADPRDLARPQALDAADGTAAVNAVTRYYDDEPRELLDIDFSKD